MELYKGMPKESLFNQLVDNALGTDFYSYQGEMTEQELEQHKLQIAESEIILQQLKQELEDLKKLVKTQQGEVIELCENIQIDTETGEESGTINRTVKCLLLQQGNQLNFVENVNGSLYLRGSRPLNKSDLESKADARQLSITGKSETMVYIDNIFANDAKEAI